MKTKEYCVISAGGANLRLYPSGSYPTSEPVAHLGYLEEVQAIGDWSACNTVGTTTVYLPILMKGAVRYVAESLLGELSHRERAALAAEYVYQRIYDMEAIHKDYVSVVSMATLEEQKRISCNRAASIVLQLAGVLPVGRVIGHTTADGKSGATKTTVEKAVNGAGRLIDGTYTMTRVNKLFKDLTEEQKQAGAVYVQDSNLCVSAGEGRIFSCNKTGKQYGRGGEPVLRTGGYPFTRRILYVILPR